METTENKEICLARHIVERTWHSLFLTGKAGTGKTTFLRDVVRHTRKRHIVLAPTGVAAVNAGAMTIHSFFQFGIGAYLPGVVTPQSQHFLRKAKLDLIRKLELLIIDEISMVRADLLDHIDAELRRIRRSYLPFGGVQLLMIGDLQQLPPIAQGEEAELLRRHYPSLYFFESQALRKLDYSVLELKQVYRQSDALFVELLNRARVGKLTDDDLARLNSRYIPGFSPRTEDNYVRLVTHNRMVQNVNDAEMGRLGGDEFVFNARVSGTFPPESFPTAAQLVLKTGAQVMFIKNDPDKKFINGTLGEVCSIGRDKIRVRIADSGAVVDVEQMEWENIRYQMTGEGDGETIEATTVGRFRQYPVRPAWAITIHKSQGLTFDRAVIDARAAFSPGQAYVALSRCRSLEGLVLSSPLGNSAFITDNVVEEYLRSRTSDPEKLAFALNYSPFDYDRSHDTAPVRSQGTAPVGSQGAAPARTQPKAGVSGSPSAGNGATAAGNVSTAQTGGPARQRPQRPAAKLSADADCEMDADSLRVLAALKVWRLEKARELNVPAFHIFSNKVLDNIAALKPRTMEQLLAVSGIGPAKAASYGEILLKMTGDAAESLPPACADGVK